MPDKHGFDHLPTRGNITLRCIWCAAAFRSGTPEGRLARHARVHEKERLAAAEATKREVETAQNAIAV